MGRPYALTAFQFTASSKCSVGEGESNELLRLALLYRRWHKKQLKRKISYTFDTKFTTEMHTTPEMLSERHRTNASIAIDD